MEQAFLHGQPLVFRRDFGRVPGVRDLSLDDPRFDDDDRAQSARAFATSRRLGTGHHTWQAADADLYRDALVIRRAVADDSSAGRVRLVGGG